MYCKPKKNLTLPLTALMIVYASINYAKHVI